VLVATLTSGAYQMAKLYANGALTKSRLIQKAVAGSGQFLQSGAPLTTGVTLDTTTGLVTITPAPTGSPTLTWTGQFDVPVRFDVDQMKKQIMDRNGAVGDLLVDRGSIPLIEIRP